jgi:hypothetical protein
LRSEDGGKLWLSRLREGDRRLGTGYEISYGRWIPGDPWQALQLTVVLGSDLDRSVAAVRASLAELPNSRWDVT